MKPYLALFLVFALSPPPAMGQAPAKAVPQTPPAKQEEAAGAKDARRMPIEELLPGNTLFFLTTTNLSGIVENFRRLGAWRALETRLPKSDLESEESPLKIAAEFLSAGINDAAILDEVRIGAAWFPPKQAQDAIDAVNAAGADAAKLLGSTYGSNMAVFVEADNAAQAARAKPQFLAFFSEMFTDLGKPEDAKPVNLPAFKGYKVERYQGGYLGTMIGATFVLADQRGLELLLAVQNADRHTSEIARLADDLDYAQTRSQTVLASGLFGYVSGRVMTEYASQAMPAQVSGMLGDMAAKMMEPGSIRAMSMTSSFEREGVVDRFTMAFDPAKRNVITTLFSGPGLNFPSIKYVPAGTSILVNHSVDYVKLYEDMILPALSGVIASMEAFSLAEKEMTEWREKQGKTGSPRQVDEQEVKMREEALKRAYAEVGKPEFFNALMAKYEREAGLKFRDELARSLGNEFTVAASIPPPASKPEDKGSHFAVFIQLREREAARLAVNKLISWGMGVMGGGLLGGGAQKNNVDPGAAKKEKTDEELKQEQEQRLAMMNMLPRERYKNTEIISMMVLGMAWVDDYLILSDNTETLKRLIDNAGGNEAIDRDAAFTRAMSGAGGAMTTRIYVGPSMFEEMLGGFLKNWTGNASGDLSGAHNIAATIAAFANVENNKLQAEVFSPMGLPGLFLFESFSSSLASRPRENEGEAQRALRTIAAVQKRYAAKNQQRFGTLTELAAFQKANPPSRIPFGNAVPDGVPPAGPGGQIRVEQRRGANGERVTREDVEAFRFNEDLGALATKSKIYRYDIKLRPDRRGFEATASPVKYSRNSRRSFFIDQTGKLRGADKKGTPATAGDTDVNEKEEQ
ncbi:MAG: hypothetical protein ACKV2V_29165 [Blastocatellia bacterium]